MANIKDVAKKAGVSISTVSYSINDSPKVSKGTKKRVLTIAKELGYHPNGSARSLKMKKTNIIGLFLKELVGDYYSDVIEGVENAISQRGYDLIIASLHGGILGNAYNLLREGRVDGAIVFGTPIIPNEFIREISKKTPIVISDSDADIDTYQKGHICIIIIDNMNGASEAVSHLINLGYKKIGYISGNEGSYDNGKRFQAYRQILEENKLEFNENWVVKGGYNEIIAYNAIKDMIKKGGLPEAFFSASDQMAIGAMRAFEEFGVKIPQDIAIVGFDDIKLASIVRPPLTTVNYKRYEMGKMAVELIFDMLEGNTSRGFVTMATKLVIRESCGEKLKKHNH